MKTLFLSITCMLISLFSIQTDSRTITGKVVDSENLPIIGANVLIKGTEKDTLTDIDGTFSIDVDASVNTLVISSLGYESTELKITEDNYYEVMMYRSTATLDEVVVVGARVDPKMTTTACGVKVCTESKKKKASKKTSKALEGKVAGVRIASTPTSPTMTMDFVSEESSEIMIRGFASEAKIRELPSAGQITAGEWNDLNNWKDWKNLLQEQDYKHMQKHWDIYPSERYSVFVTNEDNLPLVNADVSLWDKQDNILWKTKSDVTGRAEMWNGFQGNGSEVDEITVEKDNNTFTIRKPKNAEEGSNHIEIPLPCQKYNEVDIMFVVDATGSMGDEIQFLRSELSDVIERVKTNDENISYRTGAVFYKDKDDDYITAETDLDEGFSKTIEFINVKGAGGGGDYPEAVDAALGKALVQDWNPNALSRIIFLLLDAPPHEDMQTKKLISDQIKQAASMGIKIIPITASGINRETEFLMKFMSIATNGTYVFITDDSGIGNPHLDPVVDDYEVEKLNDLLVRVISNYSYQENCEPRKNLTQTHLEVDVFPNPASRFVNVKVDQDVDKIVLRSASGKIVLSDNDPKRGKNKIRLDNLVGGIYVISVLKGEDVLSSKSLMVI